MFKEVLNFFCVAQSKDSGSRVRTLHHFTFLDKFYESNLDENVTVFENFKTLIITYCGILFIIVNIARCPKPP